MTDTATTLQLVTSSSSTSLDETTFVSLEKLSRDAALESMATRGGYLSDDQFDALAVHLLTIGVRSYERFDPTKTVSEGDAFNFAWRQMRGYRNGTFTEGPYIDWLRTNVRDDRFEPKASTAVTRSGELPEDDEPFADSLPAIEEVAEHYAAGLAEREAWTLRHVATALATGLTLREVVEGLLGDLADAIAPQLAEPRTLTPALSSFEELFAEWLQEAA